jgi:hypothetical protein
MKKILLLIAFGFMSIFGFSQTAEIRGFVYEEETSEPSIYTSVYLKGTTFGNQTNIDGFFTISRIPPGEYLLIVYSIGFDTLKETITLKANDRISKKLYLKKSAIEMRAVEVNAEDESKKTDVRVSVNKITPKEIKQVPTIGGDAELAQYLQVVPGVIFTGDQGGQLYIRGGTPVQNKLLMDGMIIYNPFHSIGLYSVVDADIIRGADIYTGGFNVEYGDRISSVMDITTRDGNKKRTAGKVSVNTFAAKALVEGPLKKETEKAEGSSSFLLSVKNSYLDKSSKIFYDYVDSLGMPYSFTDVYGKVSMNSKSGSKFNVFGFRFQDDVDYYHVADLGWTNTGAGANFVLIPGQSSALIDGNFAYSNYHISLKENGRIRTSSISGFNSALSFNYFMGKDEFRWGIEALGFHTLYDNETPDGGKKNLQDENTTELAAFFKYKKMWTKVIFEPGIRLNYYSSLSELSVEPRVGVKYNATGKLRFKGAAGLYSQNFLSTSSDRDVVNLFYGYLSGSDNLPDEFRGEEVTSRLQKASHVIAGFELDLPFHLVLNVEGYYKNFTQLENINRDQIYPDDSKHNDKPEELRKEYIVETGIAKGADMTLKYDMHGIYIWFVYSLAFVNRDDGVREYEPNFDRRHNLNLVGSYKFGKKEDWQASARFNFGSPFPFTQTQGFYESSQFTNGIGSDILTQNGQLEVYYGDLNKGRLSYFHRLDLSLQKEFTISKNSILEATISVTNVYDRKNVFYRDRLTDQIIYQLPIIPTVGVSLTF